MPEQRGPGLSLAEWLVLCLISEGPTHGFAIACLLARNSSLGHVWHVQKPVIYRAARRLEHLGLITVSEKQPSRRGAALAQLQATATGRQAAKDGCASRSGIPGISAQNCWSSLPCSTGRWLTPGTCCGVSATSSPRSLLRSRARCAPPPDMTAFWRCGGTNRSRRRCGGLTPCWPRCLRSGLVPHVADGDRRRCGGRAGSRARGSSDHRDRTAMAMERMATTRRISVSGSRDCFRAGVAADGATDAQRGLCADCLNLPCQASTGTRQRLSALVRAALPNLAVLDQAAPPRGAGSGAPRAGLCLRRLARRARAVPRLRVDAVHMTHSWRGAGYLLFRLLLDRWWVQRQGAIWHR